MQLTLFPPESSWVMPTSFPRIPSGQPVSLDIESYDPYLNSRGPGWLTGDGYSVGVAIATQDQQWYFPYRHKYGPNLPVAAVQNWIKDMLPGRLVIMANANYDIGWLDRDFGLIPDQVEDVLINDFLIDEEELSYSLDSIAMRRLGVGKDEELLRQVAAEYGINPKSDLWKLDAKYVGPYAEMDARLTYDLWVYHSAYLGDLGVADVHKLESDLIIPLYHTNKRGVRVDIDQAARLHEEWKKQEMELAAYFKITDYDDYTKFLWSADRCGRWLLENAGISPPRTKTGAFSVKKDWLRSLPDDGPTGQLQKARELNRANKVYVHDRLLVGSHKGRVYPIFMQTKSDDGGTVTSRFACRGHNIQQIPVRSRLIDASRIRHCYLPEEGQLWAKHDFSGQEPRMMIHFGLQLKMPSAYEAKEYLEQGKKIYHYITEKCPGMSYDMAKEVFLARSYSMGPSTMSKRTGLSEIECEELLAQVDHFCPFIADLSARASRTARSRGYLKSLLGRRLNFDWWGPSSAQDAPPVKGLEKAKQRYPNAHLVRCFLHKAFNKLIQGSSADQTKKAFLDCYRAGKTLLCQVHDELGTSEPNPESAEQSRQIMQNAVQLNLPSVVDTDLQGHWK